MKKFLSVLLTLVMLFGVCSIAVSASDGDDLVITVANDLHYNLIYTKKVTETSNNLNSDFAHVGTSTRLPHEANAIIEAFFEEAAKNESDYLIIPGDITDSGTADEVAGIIEIFREFEKSGKKIYVVPGNHDVLTRSKAQFMSDYADFGYNQAKYKDTKSASYVVDLDDEYRLIAIDSTTEGTGAHSVFEERLQWIAEQGELAKKEGKKLIGMHHQNFLEHMIVSGIIQPGGVVTAKNEGAAEVYAKAGIKYVFTGHTHDHDITSYTAEDGSVIYDAVTGSLNGKGSLYRVVTFGDEVKFETKSVDKIDVSLLPQCISDNAKALAAENFPEYQRIATDLSYYIVMDRYTTARYLKSLLKLEDENLNALIDKVAGKLNEAVKMPFAKADEIEEGKSIESLLAPYKFAIPETEYRNIIDVGVAIYQAHNMGDEVVPPYSDEMVLATRGLGAALGYALSDVSAEEYAKTLSSIARLVGDIELSVDFFLYAGDAISRFEGINVLITTVLLPVLTKFANDDAPADNNVTLPGYDELVEEVKELTFFEKVVNFFKMIFDAIRTFFTFRPAK